MSSVHVEPPKAIVHIGLCCGTLKAVEGRVLQMQWGDGRGPSKGQLGLDPHLGALDFFRAKKCCWSLIGNMAQKP